MNEPTTVMGPRALRPLESGNILIVGVKATNFDEELRNHPRIVMWDSQNQHWSNKDMPFNVRVVFMTRFISHTTSTRILAEARKRRILIFNPDGTGTIVRQVKELLNMNQPTTEQKETPTMTTPKEEKPKVHNKLQPLKDMIDFTKSNIENARAMFARAKELGITTTENSLSQLVTVARRKQGGAAVIKSLQPKLDVSVEILDNMIKELNDMRDFLISTVEENRMLKARMEKLKSALD